MNNIEIERKFLVIGDFKSQATSHTTICQGYLVADAKRTVRIRLRDTKGYITIKGESSADGLQRFEWEKEIEANEAKQLFKLCLPGSLEKVRWIVEFDGHTFEVDEFGGENEGLIMAEVELNSANEKVNLPSWIGKEVTGDKRYYNSYLSQNPYKNWKDK